jgi:hypothetical protein
MIDYQYDEKEVFNGKKVKVLGATFEEGKPEGRQDWRTKLATREEKLGYIKTALRYWYSKDWYGSEKRKGSE